MIQNKYAVVWLLSPRMIQNKHVVYGYYRGHCRQNDVQVVSTISYVRIEAKLILLYMCVSRAMLLIGTTEINAATSTRFPATSRTTLRGGRKQLP